LLPTETLAFTDDIITRINAVLDDGRDRLGTVSIAETTATGMSRTPGGIEMARETIAARDAALAALKDIAAGLAQYRDGVASVSAEVRAVDGAAGRQLSSVPVPVAIDQGAACTTQPELDDESLTCVAPESSGGDR
jgi:hypothetical protein